MSFKLVELPEIYFALSLKLLCFTLLVNFLIVIWWIRTSFCSSQNLSLDYPPQLANNSSLLVDIDNKFNTQKGTETQIETGRDTDLNRKRHIVSQDRAKETLRNKQKQIQKQREVEERTDRKKRERERETERATMRHREKQ